MYDLLNSYRRMTSSLNADEFLEFASKKMSHGNFIDIVETKTINQEKSDLWYDMKIGRITASKISEVTRCTPRGVNNLRNGILGYSSGYSSFAMKRGLRLQNQVIAKVSRLLKSPLSSCGLLLDPKHPAIGASPDAVGPNFVIEIKCPSSQNTLKNYVSDKIDPNTGSCLKPKSYAQIQLQMHFRKVKFGYFVIADPDFESTEHVDIFKVDYNESFANQLIDDAMEFWKTYVFPAMLNQI